MADAELGQLGVEFLFGLRCDGAHVAENRARLHGVCDAALEQDFPHRSRIGDAGADDIRVLDRVRGTLCDGGVMSD